MALMAISCPLARCRVHHHANARPVGAGNERIEAILINSGPFLCDAVLVAPFAIDENFCTAEFYPVVAEAGLQPRCNSDSISTVCIMPHTQGQSWTRRGKSPSR